MKQSYIIPVLNEAEQLPHLIPQIKSLLEEKHEVIVVDGGSSDGSSAEIRTTGCVVLTSLPGRARQMNLGARAAIGDVFIFLHADTRLPEDVAEKIDQAMYGQVTWGRFNVKFPVGLHIYSLIAWLMNHRSCMTGIATGDQTLFLSRALFECIGGYPDIPLMEDIAISKKLKSYSSPTCLNSCVTISTRRWERKGVYKTIFLMWFIRLAYFIGTSPALLHKLYYR